MIKVPGEPDGDYTYHGTDYHLRCFIDPSGKERPVFVVHEPNDNRGRPLAETRTDLAVELSGQLDLTPDRVTWIEQARDGSLTSIEFKPYIQEIRSYSPDLPREEIERDERNGLLRPERIHRYNVSESPLPRETLENRVGEPLPVPESWADRQNREFERLHSPSKWLAPERADL